MAETRGAGTTWLDNTAGQGTSNGVIKQAQPGTGGFGVTTYSETSNTYKQLGIGAISAATTPAAQVSNSFNITVAEFDATATGTGSQLPANRALPAQTITVLGQIAVGQADVGGTFDVRAIFSVLNVAGNTVTQIGVATQTGLSATLATNVDFSVGVPCSTTDFPPGTTLQLTLYASAKKATLANQTLQVRRGAAAVSGNSTTVVFAAPGLRYNYTRPQTGAVTSAATLKASVVKYFTGASTPVGTLIKQTNKFYTGTVASTGSLVKRINKTLTGLVNTPSGTLIKVDKKLAGGTTLTSAIVQKTVLKTLTGSVASSSTVIRNIARRLTGTVNSAANLIKIYVKNLRGFLYGPAGSGGATVVKKNISYNFDD